MAIRLTESKLRQIIREEASKLTRSRRSTRRLSEMGMPGGTSEYDQQAAEYGMTHYIDYDVADEEGFLSGFNVGDNVAEALVDVGYLEGVLSGSEDLAILIDKSGPGGGFPVVRFYADGDIIQDYASAFGDMEGDAPRTDLIKKVRYRPTDM